MRKKRPTATAIPRIVAPDFEAFVGDLTMKFWNQLREMPEFGGLEMKDFATLFQAMQHALRPYLSTPGHPGRP